MTVRTLIPSFALILSFGNDVFQFYFLFFSSVPMWCVTLIIPCMSYILGITCSIYIFLSNRTYGGCCLCCVLLCVYASVRVCVCVHTQVYVCHECQSLLSCYFLRWSVCCLLIHTGLVSHKLLGFPWLCLPSLLRSIGVTKIWEIC